MYTYHQSYRKWFKCEGDFFSNKSIQSLVILEQFLFTYHKRYSKGLKEKIKVCIIKSINIKMVVVTVWRNVLCVSNLKDLATFYLLCFCTNQLGKNDGMKVSSLEASTCQRQSTTHLNQQESKANLID